MRIEGTIERVLFSKNTFSAVVVRYRDVEGVYQSISAAGKIAEAQEGMKIVMEGEIVHHPRFGKQLEVTNSTLELPKTRSAVVRYLSSGFFSGISVVIAERIVDHFGTNVVEEIIEGNPMRLTEIRGIGKKKAKQIAQDHAHNFVYRELASFNLTDNQITKLYEQYGKRAADILRNHPYSIIYDIIGFGFGTVDAIALKNGMARDDPRRIAAAITYVLTDIGNQGHCWCHVDNLAGMISEALPEVSVELIAGQIANEIKSGNVVLEDYRVYAKKLYDAEVNTAKDLVLMLNQNPSARVTEKCIAKAISDVEAENEFVLDRSQRNAIEMALRNRISIITGGPGSGKSTIIAAIIKAFMYQFKMGESPDDHILLCAPTGKASRRMSELTGIRAESAQRAIFRQKKFEKLMREAEIGDGDMPEDIEDYDPITNKLIILDEASMVDIYLAQDLLDLAKENNQLVMIGDVEQLPPIGPGNFFRDCVLSPFIPTARLELSHRQQGAIAINAKRINEGLGMHALKLDDPSFMFIPAEKDEVREKVIKAYMELIEIYDISDVACVVPVRKSGRSQTSSEDLNQIIRERLNPPEFGKRELKEAGFREGDRIMNTINDYEKEVFNGDCGFIACIDEELNVVYIEMDDGRIIEFKRHEIKGRFTLAYALSTHKAQGSEYKAVVVAQSREHYTMLQRNLLYTAITRAKQVVTLVGEYDAINIAVSKIPSQERNTNLKDRIKSLMVKSK